ncbi:MAG: S41 family peptidase [Gammaproteobacteria bacterium]|nr:S41 family peptidase [Gammaproteobacteria bacterium]
MISKTGVAAFLFLSTAALGVAGCGGGGGGSTEPAPPTPANAKPTVQAIADQSLTIGDSVEVTVSVSDADATDTHTLSASVNNEGAATVTVDGMVLTINAIDSGVATVTVTAADNSGRANDTSDPATFDIAVASESGWVRGVFEEASVFRNSCAAPRRGMDPATGFAYVDRQGTTRDENNWLRSWSDHSYLWYAEIEDTDPDCCDTPAYFELMKTTQTTPSGAEKDRFHFFMDTEEWNELSQSGVSAGYGARFAVLAPRPPRDIRVAYTQPNSPATHPDAAFARGTKILAIDGVDAIHAPSRAEVDVLNAGLFPSELGEDHQFTVLDPGSNVQRNVTLRSASITSDPVQHVRVIETAAGPVGYLLFLDHIATAEKRLVDAITELAAAEIEDLVLDIRYNGGGYTVIANQLAYMIAGASAAQGHVFSELRFNDKHTVFNPVTGEVLRPTLFRTTGAGLSVAQGEPLPTLDLDRVFVLTGPGTCSASEAIINGLRGIDVEVVLIGQTTCGKPHGFYPTDNCGTTYFTVQFEIVNGTGFGDYAGGFTPDNAPDPDGVPLAGCAVGDDFDHAFGDTREARLNAALAYRSDTSCPDPPVGTGNTVLATVDSLEGGLLRSKIHGLTIPQDVVPPSG